MGIKWIRRVLCGVKKIEYIFTDGDVYPNLMMLYKNQGKLHEDSFDLLSTRTPNKYVFLSRSN